jgi:hypothetical protein
MMRDGEQILECVVQSSDGPGEPAPENSAREYPAIDVTRTAQRPISFVCVRYSDEFLHNANRSECVHSGLNEVVVVENQGNVSFENLSSALIDGLSRCSHDLVAILHEDVLLPRGWQGTLEYSLKALEKEDPDWGLVGSVGWSKDGLLRGHWSDPNGYRNELRGDQFCEVFRLDEQILILRRGSPLKFDPLLPSIHNIGHDLALKVRSLGHRTYVVDAPTIHKYADVQGKIITLPSDSEKIRGRSTFTYCADRAVSDAYIRHVWPGEALVGVNPPVTTARLRAAGHGRREVGPGPIVLLARGGGGSRLLSGLAEDLGIFLGNDLNPAGDSLDLVLPIYELVLTKLRRHVGWQLERCRTELRSAAQGMVQDSQPRALWGFKLPESILVIDEILTVFTGARVLHMVRDPLATCLRRTHMTARLDNAIGQAALVAAYKALGYSPRKILEDSDRLRMAITTRHQLSGALEVCRRLPAERYLEFRFEDLFLDVAGVQDTVKSWLRAGLSPEERACLESRAASSKSLENSLDQERASSRIDVECDEARLELLNVLSPIRSSLGYE